MKGEPPLSAEHLHQAFRRLRRQHWPDTLEGALEHPLYAPAVRGLARQLSRTPMPPAAATQRARRHFPKARPGAFDPRRAAANDHDD